MPAFSSGMPNTAPPCHQHRIISHEHQHVARTSATASNSRDADSPEAQRLDATANRPPDVGASSEMDTCPLDISPARRIRLTRGDEHLARCRTLNPARFSSGGTSGRRESL